MGDTSRRMAVVANHVLARNITSAASHGVWENVKQAPPDPILGLTEEYNADPNPSKVNLGVGAYRTEDGKPLVLDVVRTAEKAIANDPAANKEYLPIGGSPDFCNLVRDLALGRSSLPTTEGRVVTVQSISGTGALRVGAEFIRSQYDTPVVYLPDPTWGNHHGVFGAAGLVVKTYRYYDPSTKGLDFQGMVSDLGNADPGSVVLLHACAHNPTGVDPTMQQWQGIMDALRTRRLLPFFDSAYQGFASGDLDADAAAVRLFAESGMELLLAQSFAKNMGLYGERAGALSLVCASQDAAKRVHSQVKVVIRRMYSSPPKHGAAIVSRVLGDPQLMEQWKEELSEMAGRIKAMRHELYGALQRVGAPGDWSHILHQIGMFSFTGLTQQQVLHLRSKWHVYLTLDGRMSMAGLSAQRAGYLAEAMADAVRVA